mgnify:CR=1 FL=1
MFDQDSKKMQDILLGYFVKKKSHVSPNWPLQRKSWTILFSKLLLGGEFKPQCEEQFIEVGTIWMSADSLLPSMLALTRGVTNHFWRLGPQSHQHRKPWRKSCSSKSFHWRTQDYKQSELQQKWTKNILQHKLLAPCKHINRKYFDVTQSMIRWQHDYKSMICVSFIWKI